ncbi:hypothetical protein [Thermogemmatispora sp.]
MQLARQLGSRLYAKKLARTYEQVQERWPREQLVRSLKDLFGPW